MAKGIEDTAFYRWLRLAGANEVGGHPAHLGISAQDFHAYAAGRLQTWPVTMTTLTTHDTKRSEDVRARLMVLADDPGAWETWVREATRGTKIRGRTEVSGLICNLSPSQEACLYRVAKEAVSNAVRH